jgi:uncharacterized protein YbdZ (MbtH family)
MAQAEAVRPFDLAKGPVLRVTVIRLAEEDHVLLFTMHHIASDMWSMGVLVREVMALYHALSYDRPSPLDELPIQYADFAAWQRQWLQGRELEKQLDFWKGHLAGRENALGWNDAGKTGTKAECLAYIEEVWTDMRPLSLRKKMEELQGIS